MGGAEVDVCMFQFALVYLLVLLCHYHRASPCGYHEIYIKHLFLEKNLLLDLATLGLHCTGIFVAVCGLSCPVAVGS